MNNQGQAYSTFKLLIAAIVALAILMILLPIIGSVLLIFQDDPAEKTIELVNAVYNKPESIKTTTRPVTFTPGSVLSAASLDPSVQISKDQMCMSKGDFEDNDDFELIESSTHQRLIWNGTSNQLANISVMCHINAELLEDAFEDTIFEEWDFDCGICGDTGRCCAIALRNI